MTLLKNVYELGRLAYQSIQFSGATNQFLNELKTRYRNLGETILAEKNLPPTQKNKLPPETILGPEAEAKFNEFKDWLIIHDPDIFQ